MLQQWDKTNPGRVESIFTALTNVKPSQLADRDLFDFVSLTVDRSELGCEESAETGSVDAISAVEKPEIAKSADQRIADDDVVEERQLKWMPSAAASVNTLV